MPDCIVRFSGNNLKEPEVISTFLSLIKKSINKHLIVVSATKEIQDILADGMKTLCSSTGDPATIYSLLNIEIDKINALTGITNKVTLKPLLEKLETLLKGIHMTGDFSIALQDQVISFGEKISVSLLYEILNNNGIGADIRLPEEIGLLVSEEYGNASIYTDESRSAVTSRVLGDISLVPGSYGITRQGKIARVGRRAADYTAAALASIFQARELELWQIGKPFKTADDRLVPGASHIESLTYAEASELSYFNYSGIHPRIVEPLADRHIPVHVFELKQGEKIMRTRINSESIVAPHVVKSVAYTDDIAILKLNGPGVGYKPGILAKVTSAFNNQGINIRSVITAQTSINIITGKNSVDHIKKICGELELSSVNKIEIADNVSLIAVVGHGMQSHHGISAQLFSAVARNKINVVLSGSGASDLVSYLVVEEKDKIKAVQEIHKAFFS